MAAEEPTRMVDWNDRSTCVLFGDGAGAMVVTKGEELKALKVSSKSNTGVLHYKRILEPTPLHRQGGAAYTSLYGRTRGFQDSCHLLGERLDGCAHRIGLE